MSISAMTNVAMARRTDMEPKDGPNSTSAILEATSGTTDSRSGFSGALQVVMTYVPTEIVAIYTSVATAIATSKDELNPLSQWIAFSICLLMTPIAVWLMYAGKAKMSGKNVPIGFSQWPKFEMFAATLAFAAWAYSMPNSPFSSYHGYYSAGLAAIALPCSAMFLGLLAPVLQQPLKAS